MVDLSQFIIAKSDQLNADDLRPNGPLGGPITVRVTRVTGTNDKEQPIAINYDGDNGKPYKPGKSMRRVLVNFWGKDGEAYVGRWLTLYCDPDVSFGKIKVGGIRIGAMSHIDDVTEMALAVTKGAKRLFTVKRLNPPQDQGGGNGGTKRKPTPEEQVASYTDAIKAIKTLSDLAEYQADDRRAKWREGIKAGDAALFDRIVAAEQDRFRELSEPVEEDQDDDATDPPTGRTDGQHGDQHDGGDDIFPEDGS